MGEDHPGTIVATATVGELLRHLDLFDEAESYLNEALAKRRRTLGNEHPDTLMSMSSLGSVLRDQGKLQRAEALGAEAVERGREVLPDGHRLLGIFLSQYGRTLANQARFAEAESALLKAHKILEDVNGADARRTNDAAAHLARLYERWNEIEPEAGYDADAALWRKRLDSYTDRHLGIEAGQ